MKRFRDMFCVTVWSSVLIFLICLWSEVSTNAVETEACQVGGTSGACCYVGGTSGACVPLPACAQYEALLKNSATLLEGLQVIREKNCGYQDNNAKVCCPATAPTTPAPTTPPTDQSDDFVDELPVPGLCGRTLRFIDFPFPNSYRRLRSYSANDATTYPPPAIAGGQPVLSRNQRSIPTHNFPVIAHGTPVIGHGTPVISRSMARWMALLGYKNSAVFWKCGGSIITKKHVLTAAHCIKHNLYLVRVGELDLATDEPDASPFDILVKKMIPHENYTKFHNDIGVLVLQDDIDFSSVPHVSPVCLPKSETLRDATDQNAAFITGWGETDKPGERPDHLLYAYVNILANEDCARAYHGSNLSVAIDERVLCAGDAANMRDACSGDSGGPLVNEYSLNKEQPFYFQMGVISYGFRCSYHRSIGVYTSVQHFMPWIEEKVLGRRL